MLSKHLDKKNLHHAYLLEGNRDEVMKEVLEFVKDLGIDTSGNSDFVQISADSFKIDDARNLKSFANEKAFSSVRKIFLVSANNFLLEAQHAMLKMLEEPIENTHFFIVVPDANALLKTLVSRFYFISTKQDYLPEAKEAEKFITLPLSKRIDFIKELLVEQEEEDEEGREIVVLDSTRAKALSFLNALESVMQKKSESKTSFNVSFFEHVFKVREFLRMPGSSAKNLMESVALMTPNL